MRALRFIRFTVSFASRGLAGWKRHWNHFHFRNMSSNGHSYDYDLVVIGGGSGGLAAAKEVTAVKPNAKVVVFDLVNSTVHGTKWGLGGTCVNVGCIPKKLMHYAASIGYTLETAAHQFGWNGVENAKHDWAKMAGTIGDYIKSLNFSYRVGLQSSNVKYFEGRAQFIDSHTVSYVLRNGKGGKITFDRALIATGGHPTYLDIPGSQLAITSDDMFWLKSDPGPRVLVVGAGYIALECASFLRHLGHEVSVMVRGQVLRKMDTQSGEQVAELMERDGIRFIVPANPLKFESLNGKYTPPNDAKKISQGIYEGPESTPTRRVYLHSSGVKEIHDTLTDKRSYVMPPGPINVSYQYANDATKTIHVEQFDTVLLAVGRSANINELNLDLVGVNTVNGKVLVDASERTTAEHIFAIGDVATGIPKHIPGVSLANISTYAVERPELTPVAIQAGVYLARRLFGGASQLMQYQYVPTTVFTSPSEYSFVGLSEEQANHSIEEGGIGKENVEVFWSRFGSIEVSPLHPEEYYKPPRSKAFIGKNLWAVRQIDDMDVDWAEAMFDTETNSSVVVHNGDNPVSGRVVSCYRNDARQQVYDVELESDGKVLKAIPQANLTLAEALEVETASIWSKASSLAKVIVDKRTDKIVGLHFIGASAGEVLQGFALAIQIGCTKKQLDELIGIHPTSAEEFAVLSVTKSSKLSGLKQAGCGGGRCG